MPWTTNTRVMKLRRRSHAIDVVVETLDGWRRHLSGRNASLLSFFTFLSIFPLMLAAATILGLVLDGNPDLRDRILNGAAAEIPLIGEDLRNNGDALNGSMWVLVFGLLSAVWSSTRAFVGLHGALDDVWEVDVDERAAMPVQRVRAIVALVVLGLAQTCTIVVASIVTAANLPGISQILLVAATVIVNVAVLAVMFRFLTSAEPTLRDVWPGAVFAGLIFTALQHFGPRIVTQIVQNAGDTYGTFAVVIGLITWLSLLSIAAMMAAELNAAITKLRPVGSSPARSS